MSGAPDPGGGGSGHASATAPSKPIRPPMRDASWSAGSGAAQQQRSAAASSSGVSASSSPSLANKGAALALNESPQQQAAQTSGLQSARTESAASQQQTQQPKSAKPAQKQKATAVTAPVTAADAAPSKPLPHNYKTVACRYFATDRGCPKGDMCTYIHAPAAAAAEQKQTQQPQQAKQAKQPKQQPKQQQQQQHLSASTPSGSSQQRPARANNLSASPSQPASARSLAANFEDSAQRKEQASKLFSLLHGGGAGGSGNSKGQQSKSHPAQLSKKAASKPAAAASSNADAGLAGFDWSKLVSGSKEEQLKSQQLRGQHRDDAEDDAGEHDAAAADTHKLNQLLAAQQQTKPASSADSPAAAPVHLSVTDEFRSKYEASKAEESRLSTALSQLAREESQSRNGIQSPAAQSLRSTISSARASLRARYIDLLTHYSPRLNVQKSVVQKLWQQMYREIENMLTQCKNQMEKQPSSGSMAEQYGGRNTALPGAAAAAPSSAPDLFSVSAVEAEELLRSRLESALAAHFHTLDQVAKQVHERFPLEQKNRAGSTAAAAGADENGASASAETVSEEKKAAVPSPETLLAARQLLSALCVCLGDLERYRQLYILRANDAKTLSAAGSAAADPWARVLFFYTRSLLLDPASPSAAKSHNQLAVVSSYAALRPSLTDTFRGRAHFRSLYHYTRALLASSSPFPARQNILALYEQNREIYASNLRPTPDNEASLLLAACIRLWSMLDTKIALEQWTVTFEFTSQALKSMLNKAFFPGAAASVAAAAEQRLSERDMVQLMMLTLNAVDTLMAKDAAYGSDPRSAPASAAVSASALSAAALTPTTLPPFHLSHLTQHALSLLYDLLGVLVRIPVLICAQGGSAAAFYASRSLPFLPSLALAAVWIHSAFPWVLTQHESDGASMQHPGSLAARRENVRRALVGLADLLQSLENTAVPDATTSAPEASLQELHGFAPLMRCKLWPGSTATGSAGVAAAALDSFAFQSSCVVSLAKQVLFVHPLSLRLSALPPPPSTLSAAELADLQAQQAAWAAQKAAAAAGPAKAKRPSKQAKPRPVHTTENEATAAATAAVVSPKDAASSSSSDLAASEDLVGQLDDLAVDDDAVGGGGDRLFAADFTDEELVSSQSQSASQGAGAGGFTAAPSFLGSTFDASAMQRRLQQQQQPQVSEMEAMMSGAGMGAPAASSVAAASAAAAPTASTPASSSAASSAQLQSLLPRPLILLDGPNIAMRHGLHKSFSVRGLELAMDALETQFGFRCIVFIPEFCLDYEAVGAKRRAIKAGFSDTKVTGLPDNVTLLRAWRTEGKLVTTPSQDYDDSYVIEYAMKSNALVVSNDLYRDHAVAHGSSSEDRQRISAWIRSHVVSFTFIEGSFFVNPAWKKDAGAGLRKIEANHPAHPASAAGAYQRPMPAQPSNLAFRIVR